MKFRFKKGDILRMKENNRLVSPLGKDYEKNLLVVFSFWDGVSDVYVLDVRDNNICLVCRGDRLEYDPDYMDTPNEGTENEEPSKEFISQETAEELGKQMDSMRKAGEVEKEYTKKLLETLNSMEAIAIADHQAEIDEKAYYRKLRGEIFLEFLRERKDYSNGYKSAIDNTEYAVWEMYKQDQEFRKEVTKDEADKITN